MATDSKLKYVLDHSSEIERLTLNHALYKDALHGKLIQAPIKVTGPVRLLDIATNDGSYIYYISLHQTNSIQDYGLKTLLQNCRPIVS